MIPGTIVLNFDPKIEAKEIQDVFSDNLARTIWLAVKYKHIVNQYFNTDCLEYAEIIKRAKQKGSLTAKQLLRILSGFGRLPGHGVIGEAELTFAADLLPFVNGEKIIKFDVVTG